MASELLSSVFGGVGGSFVAESAGITGTIAGGSTTNALVVTPPAGQRVFLYFLNNFGSSSDNVNMDILFGTRKVIDNKSLRSLYVSSNDFNIGNITMTAGTASSQELSGTIPHLIGKTNEVLTINFLSPSTIPVAYAYQLGE